MALPTSFAELDELLLKRVFQPVADFLAWHGGWGCGAVAGFCVDVAALAWIAARAPGISAAGYGAPGAPVVAAGVLGIGLIALVSLRILFRRATSGARGNPLRHTMRPHRGIALLLLLVRLAQLRMPDLDHGIWAQGIWAQGIWAQGIWAQGIWAQGIWAQGIWGGEGSWAGAADVVMLLFSAGALYLGACAEPPPTRRRGKVLVPGGAVVDGGSAAMMVGGGQVMRPARWRNSRSSASGSGSSSQMAGRSSASANSCL